MTIHERKYTPSPGKLVVIEGIDGSGKDTQADLLVEKYGYIKTRLPFYENQSGKILREMVDSQKTWVSEERFQAAMVLNYLEHFDTFMRPLLEQGKKIVMTRYMHSMHAYAMSFGINDTVLEGLTMALMGHINYRTDIKIIYLDIPVWLSLSRIELRDKNSDQKQEKIFENQELLEKVASHYEDILTSFSFVVDGHDSIENIHNKIAWFLWEK